jgi:hypothetical protein
VKIAFYCRRIFFGDLVFDDWRRDSKRREIVLYWKFNRWKFFLDFEGFLCGLDRSCLELLEKLFCR